MTPCSRALEHGRACALWVHLAAAAVLFIAVLAGAPASAQQATTTPREGEGRIAGHVFDAQTGAPLGGVRVVLIFPAPARGDAPRREAAVTDLEGVFAFESVPAASYSLDFSKSGYIPSSMTDFVVQQGQENRADFPLPPQPAGAAEGEPEIETFVVTASLADEILGSLELRTSSEQLVNIMDAEELAKFAAVDMADALKRVAGVNVVEGQFAIIRGLEDRYSSTLYNEAPVPSPDPDRQSPQLDLFPAEVVDHVVVAKTFGPELPSNSASGSIDIVTSGYQEDFEAKLKVKGGFNENAVDRFLRSEGGNPVGTEAGGLEDTFAREAGAFVGGHQEVGGREVRFKLLGNWEVDYGTEVGFQEDREPRTRIAAPPDGDLARGELSLTSGRFDLTTSEFEEQGTGYAGLGFDLDELSDHSIDLSLFWTRKDSEVVQLKENGYFPRVDYLRPGGPFEAENQPGTPVTFDDHFNGTLANSSGNATLDSWIGDFRAREFSSDFPTKGRLWFASFLESKSFRTERDLLVPQINGDHQLEALLPGLHLSWAANWAKTTQRDEALGARMWYEPCGYSEDARLVCPPGVARVPVPTTFPVTVESLGPGKFIGNSEIFANENDVEEAQWFGRSDLEYDTPVTEWLEVGLRGGVWVERAKREVESSFLENLEAVLNPSCTMGSPICDGAIQGTFNAVFADTSQELGRTLFGFAFPRRLQSPNETQSEAEREIDALSFGAKTTFWEDLDLLGGVRLENILIKTDNDPFVVDQFGQLLAIDRTPLIFPSKFVFFDRFGDNFTREGFDRSPPFNDQILGVPVQPGPCRGQNGPLGEPPPPDVVEPGSCVDLVSREEIDAQVDGEIDERLVLPSAALAYRPIHGLALRAAYSQTTARPSFRELGYYGSVEPASDDLIVGNPQLQLSDVESWDARAEYVYGDFGDLVALSGFYKTIEEPIESIIVRNPANFEENLSVGLFRTFFNNPNDATVWGIEAEARKSLGFLDLGLLELGLLDSFSVGGNFTWIQAEVGRTQAELQRAEFFFPAGSPKTLEKSRRLFAQPQWIANVDVSLDQPAWGTKVTLALYAISDVLDAAGAATIGRNGQIVAITLDRYVDSFHTLDFILSQKIWGGLAVKLSAKNLTDSRRQIIYDPEQTRSEIAERSYRLGRDYSLELSYTFSEVPDFDLPSFLRPDPE